MMVHAHRGASAYAPENTLPAFELAVRLGAPAVENDVHLTSDNHIVVCHDGNISRTSNGTGEIAEMTLDELRRYNFGTMEEPTPIPTLEEFIEVTRPMKLINIELKPPLPDGRHLDDLLDLLYRTLQEAGRIQNTIVSTFCHDWAGRLKMRYPDLRCGLLYGERRNAEETIQLVEHYHADAIHPNIGNLESEEVQACHARGIKVNAWTIDAPEFMAKAVELGVDGMITNVPDRAMKYLSSLGLPYDR